jgi:DNA-binding transcriptional MocR family regulator
MTNFQNPLGSLMPDEKKKDMVALLTTTLSTSVPAQIALASYLKKGGYDRHLRSLRHTLLLQQIKFVDAVERHFPEGTRLTSPSGGYFLWVKLPDGVNSLELHRAALKHGISIAPGPIFSSHKKYTDYVRLNYGHIWDDQIESAIETLGKITHKLAAQKAA